MFAMTVTEKFRQSIAATRVLRAGAVLLLMLGAGSSLVLTDEVRARTAFASEDVVENSLGMRFIRVEPGEFLMGSPADEPHRFAGEQQHQVRLTKAYFLGMEEVTVNQYKAVMGKPLRPAPDGNLPEIGISWYDAEDFCRKLTELEAEQNAGRSYRLPTEAEWEYACRAGTRTVYSWGDDPEQGESYAWSVANSAEGTKRVGSRKPNPWGFYDMHGSVWEWCSDWYDDLPAEPATDPKGPATGEFRVLRGGAFNSPLTYLRSAIRVPWDPAGQPSRGINLGLRVVLVIDAPENSGKDK